MNATLVLKTIEQRLRSPVRMTLVGMGFFLPLLALSAATSLGFSTVANGSKFAFVIGAGLIGQDLSAGVLQLLFARPVPRWTYVTSRWIGCVTLTLVITLLQIVCAALIMGSKGFPVDASTVLPILGTEALAAIGIVSVLTLFSSVLGGFGDLALYLLFAIVGGAFQAGGQITQTGWALRTGQEISRFLSPTLNLDQWLHATPLSWFVLSSYVSTVVLCVTLAIVLMNRRELSYASG